MWVVRLDREAHVARAARALRPFRNIDIRSLAVGVIRAAGFTPAEAKELADDAVTVEQARRSIKP